MISRRNSLVVWSLLCAAVSPIAASADTVVLARDSVVPVIFDSSLTLSDSRVGDHFTCHVDADRDLPTGTRFEGEIVAIRYPRPYRPASMDLQFTAIDLPNGGSVRINAVPIPLNKDLVRTDADGRLYVKNDVRKQGEYVLGGALGGYLLGSVFHRRITGLLLGTIVGVAAAGADRAHSENDVVEKGAKLGALFNREVTVDLSATGESERPATGRSGWDGYTHSGGAAAPVAAPPAPQPAAPAPAAPAKPAGPPADIAIRFGDKTLSFDDAVAPYYQGETVMVPLKQMADALGLSYEKGDKDSVYIENDNDSLKLDKDSVNYRFNGNHGTLSHPVAQKGDVLYAPVDVFAQLVSKDLIVNGRKLQKDQDNSGNGG